MLAIIALVAAAAAGTVVATPVPPCSQYDPTKALETPCNVERESSFRRERRKNMRHTAHPPHLHSLRQILSVLNSTRYQIRVYGVPSGQSFSTASVTADSYSRATSSGFRLNFAYIEGENAIKKKIPMTAPVVTRNPSGDEENWLVSFFTPQSLYPTAASAPVPSSPNVTIEAMPLSTFAVVEFGGEANEADYKLASSLLKDALVADGMTLAPKEDVWAEAWCGYDAPNDLFNRHNEAWVKIVLA
jgi:hypothetical protein